MIFIASLVLKCYLEQVLTNTHMRKVCFIITSKIHYARSKLILRELRAHPDIELQIVVGGSAILEMYGDVLNLMAKDGFKPNAKITMTLEGGSPVAMAKTTGIGITEFATAFENLEPDVVLVRGDRYEVLSAAIAAAYLNISLAHIEGGDISGTIDESVRHAITKLAHIHFATNEDSARRIIQMGEPKEYVFIVGCPELEFVEKNNFTITSEYINHIGVGDVVDIKRPYVMVMQHSVTTEMGHNREHITETLEAAHAMNIPAIWFWPNIDAGTDEISKGIRSFRERMDPPHIRFLKSLPAEEFAALLKNAACLVGNSSAGIKECSYFGTPVVNIGTRQTGRMRGAHVADVGYDRHEIKAAVHKQIEHGKYEPSLMYYRADSSKLISDILTSVNLYTQKQFIEQS